MKININEDFNEAFPDEAFAGFTLKQCLVGGGAFALAVAAALLLWRFAGIGIVECTYIAVPAMFPVCALGLGPFIHFFNKHISEKLCGYPEKGEKTPV